MQIPIFIEPVAGNGFRSRGGEPFSLSAEGATREEVMAKLKEQLRNSQASGAELVSVEAGNGLHPLATVAGIFKDDPDIDDWIKDMAEYRQTIDADSDNP